MRRALALLGLTAVSLVAPPARAALPFELQPRPRVYVDATTVARLRESVFLPTALNGPLLPQAEGALSFAVYLAPPGADASGLEGLVDDYEEGRSHFFVRHYDEIATDPSDCPLQIAFQDDQGNYVTAWSGHAACDAWHTLTVTWSSAAGASEITLDGVTTTQAWTGAFVPSGQRLVFHGRADGWDDLAVYDTAAVAEAPPIARFELSEGAGDVVAASVGAERLQLLGSYAWTLHAADDPAVLLSQSPDGRDGVLEVMPPTRLSESFAALERDAESLADTVNSGGDLLAPADAVTAHPGSFVSPVQVLGMAWLLTDDDRYRTALFTFADQILAVAPDSGNDFTQPGRAAALGMVYDWLHADVTSRTHAATGNLYRDDIAAFVKATALVQGDFICGWDNTLTAEWGCSNGTPAPAASGGHADDNNGRLAVAVLALVDDFPELEPLATALWQGDTAVVQPFRDFVCVDGGHHFGYDYGGAYSQLSTTLLWRSATDQDPLRAYMGALPYRWIYGMRGDGFFPAVGDAFRLPDWGVGTDALVGSTLFGDAYAESYFRERAQVYSNGFWELLLWDPEAPRAPLSALPLARHFAVAGQVVVRESWDYASSALLEVHSPSFQAGNHQHYDHNAFSLFYRAPLLVDAGIYDLYGTSHWTNFYRRTVAHNAITVFDPTEVFADGSAASNDGGQQHLPEYPTLADVQSGGANAVRGVTHFESADRYSYVAADASAAYAASKLEPDRGWVRSIVWLPTVAGSNHPAFLIHDRVTKTAAKADLTTRFLLHSMNEPTTSGDTPVATCRKQLGSTEYRITNGGGAAAVRTLLPADATVHKVGGFDGGDDCRFLAWDASGVETNYPPLPENDPEVTPGTDARYRDIGGWRLEVSPATPSRDEEFLHSVAVLDEGDPSPSVALVSATGATAATLGSTVVVFANGSEPVSFASPGADGLAVVVGLPANARFGIRLEPDTTVWVEAEEAGVFTTTSQGVLSFLMAELGANGSASEEEGREGCSCRFGGSAPTGRLPASMVLVVLALLRRGAVSRARARRLGKRDERRRLTPADRR